MLNELKCPKYYSKININKKIFLIIRSVLTIESIYFMSYGNPISLPSFLIGITSLIVTILYIFSAENSTWKKKEIRLYILIAFSATELYLFFLSCSRIAFKKELMDEAIIKIDEFFLGKIFPRGQISLYLDENKNFGPNKIGGKILNNFLLFFYFTYYLNPYVFIFIILFKNCFQETLYRNKNNGQKSPTYYNSWNKFYFTVSIYIATYIQVFFINVLVPASSPRLFLKNEYKNQLEYFGLNKIFGNIKDDKSANSFPSGHVAETFCLFLPFLAMKRYAIALFVLIVSLIIGLATVVLRYHYFADVLVGMLNSALSFLICYFLKIILKIKYPELNDDIQTDSKLLERIGNTEFQKIEYNDKIDNENSEFRKIASSEKLDDENEDN